MARRLRVGYPGAIDHLMNRGDRREEIFRDDADRQSFLDTLGEACGKAGWQVHALNRRQDLGNRPKGDPCKVATARRLRRETTMTLQWIARRLGMGSASMVSHCLRFR